MKAYVYLPDELRGLEAKEIPLPSTLERTGSPAQADVFYVPLEVGDLERRLPKRIYGVQLALSRLPYWGKHEKCHFFFMHSDEDRPIRTKAIVLRQSVNRHKKDPNTVAWPPPVEDLGHLAGRDYEALMFHVCFVGLGTDPQSIRQRCIASLRGCTWLNSYIDTVGRHWCHYEGTPEGDRRRVLFVDGLKQSRLVLAPRGAGQHSYRFFEALSAGRIPILVADDYELPFEEWIDYDRFIFRLEEKYADELDAFILGVNEQCRPVPCMQDMAYRARRAWLEYLAPVQWDSMVLRVLEDRL